MQSYESTLLWEIDDEHPFDGMAEVQVIETDKSSDSGLQKFRRDALRKVSWGYITWLLAATLLAFAVYYPWRNAGLDAITPALYFYFPVLIIHCVLRLKHGGKANILTMDILFLLLYTVFHLGYVVLLDLNQVPFDRNVIFYVTGVPKCMFVVNLGLLGFLFGYEIVGPKSQVAVSQGGRMIPTANWCHFGIFLMALALGMHFAGIIGVGPSLIAAYGYKALARIDRYAPGLVAYTFQIGFMVMNLGIVIYLNLLK